MEDDKLKKLIQNIDLDEPTASFTDNIMKMVETEEGLNLNPALLFVIKNELLAEPPVEFSDNLMANIQPEITEISEPIITKKTGLIISGASITILLLILITSHSNVKHLAGNSYFSGFGLNLSGTTTGIIKITTSVLQYLIPLSILLFMDYFFRTRQRQLTSREPNN